MTHRFRRNTKRTQRKKYDNPGSSAGKMAVEAVYA